MKTNRAESGPNGHHGIEAQKSMLRLIDPHESGGFFDLSLPVYDTELQSLELTDEKDCKGGKVYFEKAIMSDGTPYPIVTGIPNESLSDTAIVYSTAWMTNTKGHNSHTLHHMMRRGYPAIMIGAESQHRNQQQWFGKRLTDSRNMTLARTVHNMNRILDEKLPALNEVRENEIITLGESRGAMTGFGFNVPQYSGDRKVVYGDHTAPCFARKPSLTETPEIALQLASEIKTLGGLAVDLFGLKVLRQKSGTLHIDPEYYAKEIIKTWNLMNGQAGNLATATRPETPMHIRVFNGDGWSQAEEWEELFRDRDNVKIERADGHHLDIAEPTTLGRISARLDNIVAQRGYDGSFEDIDYEAVEASARGVAKSRRKIVIPFIGNKSIQAATA